MRYKRIDGQMADRIGQRSNSKALKFPACIRRGVGYGFTPLFAIFSAVLCVGCASSETVTVAPAAPVSPFYSPFQTSVQDSPDGFRNGPGGSYVAATLAQAGQEHRRAADHFVDAMKRDPLSLHVAERGFFALVYAGRMDEAVDVAGQIALRSSASDTYGTLDGAGAERAGASGASEEGMSSGFSPDSRVTADEQSNDLAALVHVLGAYKIEDWPLVRRRAAYKGRGGFGNILRPLLVGWSYAAEQQKEKAQAALKSLFENPSLSGIAEEHWAYMLDHMGFKDEAAAAYLRLMAIRRDYSVQPILAYADLLIRDGKSEDARAFLDKQTARFSNNNYLLRESFRIVNGRGVSHKAASPQGGAGLIFFRLGSELGEASTLQAAVVYLRLAAYMVPNVADLQIYTGNLLEQTGDFKGADAAYAAVPQHDLMWRSARLRRIQALRQAERMQEAEELVTKGLVETPADKELLTILADMYRASGKYGEAALSYSRLIDMLETPSRQDWWLFFARGVCYEQTGNWPKAEIDLQFALKLNTNQPDILNYLGYSWIDRGYNIAAARKMIEAAVAARPRDGFILDSLGWSYYLSGDYEDAVVHLEQAIILEPGDATINAHLGDAYWKVGRRIEARFQWQHALDSNLDPDEETALRQKMDRGIIAASTAPLSAADAAANRPF